MDTLIVVLLIVQSLLLVGLLLVMSALLSRIGATGQKVNELVAHVDKLVTTDVASTLAEARKAVQRIESLAENASGTLQAAEPVVKAVSGIASVFQKPSTPLWMDAIRLAVGVFGVVRSRKADTKKALSARKLAEEE